MGVPVTAHDFEYAWRRVLDPRNARPRVSCSMSSRAVDDLTLAGILLLMTSACMPLTITRCPSSWRNPPATSCRCWRVGPTFPVPRHIVESRGEKWAEPSSFVSNGAFTLELGGDSESWVLRRNPGYGGRFRGNVERIEITLLKESTEGVWNPSPQIMALYDADQIDFASPFFPGAQTARRHHPQEEVSWPAMHVFGLVLNWRRPPFDDPRVRRALGIGLDRCLLVELTFGEEAAPADGGLVPPGLPGHSPGIGLAHDPDEAPSPLGRGRVRRR